MTQWLWVLTGLVIFGCCTVEGIVSCPTDFPNEHGGVCYRLSSDKMKFDEARTECNDLGGDLAKIYNVSSEGLQAFGSFIVKNDAWIGLTNYQVHIDNSQAADFRWLIDDTSLLDYETYVKHNALSSVNCGGVIEQDGELNCDNTNATKYYVCQDAISTTTFTVTDSMNLTNTTTTQTSTTTTAPPTATKAPNTTEMNPTAPRAFMQELIYNSNPPEQCVTYKLQRAILSIENFDVYHIPLRKTTNIRRTQCLNTCSNEHHCNIVIYFLDDSCWLLSEATLDESIYSSTGLHGEVYDRLRIIT